MKKLLFSTMCAISAGLLMAQETAAEVPAAEAAAEAPAETIPLEAAPSDGGTEAMVEAQAMKVETQPAQVAPAKFKSAQIVLQEIAKAKGWPTRWDKKKGRIFKIESAGFITKNPATDADFFLKRDLAAKKAVLKAKIGIIETFNVQMQGSEKLEVPGSDVEKKLGAERAAIANAVAVQKQELAKLLAKTNQAEADVVRGTTLSQRLDDVLVACIKKLDEAYDAYKHDATARARLDDLKAKLAAAQKDYDELKKKADTVNKQLKSKQTTSVSKVAQLPLFGCTTLLQTESWDKTTGRYQVAVLVTWSKLLEEAARAIATGKPYTTKPGTKSVNDWLAEQDLSCMIGPRQYVDDEGNRWFLGISSRRYTEAMNESARDAAMDYSEMSASQMAVFCIFADVESSKRYTAVQERRGDAGDTAEELDVAAESMSKTLSQAFEKRTINGLQELASEEVESPITGETMYVKVYGINANDAVEAMATEDRLVVTKIESERRQSWLNGRALANEAAVRAAKNRPEDVAGGAEDQGNNLGVEYKKRNPKVPPVGTPKPAGAEGSQPKNPGGKPTGGVWVSGIPEGDV